MSKSGWDVPMELYFSASMDDMWSSETALNLLQCTEELSEDSRVCLRTGGFKWYLLSKLS